MSRSAAHRWLLVLAALNCLGGCTLRGPLYAEGEIGGEAVAANLDSPLAQAYLQPQAASRLPQDLNARLQQLEHRYPGVPQPLAIAELTERTSIDFASLLFARRLLAQPQNLQLQLLSSRLAERLGEGVLAAQRARLFQRYHALVIPGWYWQTRSETGADLAYPRRRFAALGLSSTLVETDEHANVERNAAIIAAAVREARSLGKPVILISASKGGADTAYALGHELAGEPLTHVHGWLNIGGVVGGSTFAQIALADPAFWLAEEGMPPDTPLSALHSMLPGPSAERLAGLRLPQHVPVVNYAALPFASTLHARSQASFAALAPHGPNDGAALMHELLVPGAPSVLEIGVDHYMRDARVMPRVVALMMILMDCRYALGVREC